MFGVWDVMALVGYLAAITGLGLFFSRRNTSFNEFMFGGGRMPWPAIGISLIATSVSATTFLGNPADSFQTDMTYLMCHFGTFAAIGIVAIWFIPRFRALDVQSAYEILQIRFSRKVRLLASCLYSAHLLLRTGILIYGPALVLARMFGIDIYLAIAAIALLAVVYTYFGGMQAVVWTDVMQFVVLLGGGLLALYFCIREIGSVSEMVQLAQAAGKTKWFATGLDPGNARTLLSAGLVYIVFEVAIRGCDQQFVQRYLACKNVREANFSSLLSALLGLAVSLVFFWIGAALFVYFKVALVAPLPEGIGINDVFPHFILSAMPAGVRGLMVAAIFAAAMSSLDSAITALANTTVTDFLDAGRQEGSLGKARRWVLLWGLAATLAAVLCVAGQQSLLSKALFFTSLFTGPLLGLFCFAFFLPKIKPEALFYGALCGMASLLPFSKIPILESLWWEPVFRFSWPWNPLISLAGRVLFGLTLARLRPAAKAVPENAPAMQS